MKLSGIDANLVVALHALLQERSVTRAAARLGIGQPGLSHSLARLREHFRDPLLVAKGRELQLTDKARQLLEPAASATLALREVFEERPGFDPHAARSFVFACADLFAQRFGPEIVGSLRRDAPGIVPELRPLQSRSTEQILSDGVELAFGTFEDVPVELNQQHLFDDSYVCVLRKAHPYGARTLTLKAYAKLQHLEVLPAPQARPGARIDRFLAARGMRRHVALRVPYFSLAARLLADSDLVLTMTEGFARELAELAPLRIMPAPLSLAPLSFSQIWSRRLDQDPAHRFLRETCARVCRDGR
jgi:DNA-binding transcriptional LysR family regulator